MSNKQRGIDVEDFVKKFFNLKDSNTHEFDALDGSIPIEIKSTELYHDEKNKKGSYRLVHGRINIHPDAHLHLADNAEYVFLILHKGYPLFTVRLPKNSVDKLLKDKKIQKKWKLTLTKIIQESLRIKGSTCFLSQQSLNNNTVK